MQRAKERETMAKAQEETARREKEAKKSEEWHAPGFGPGATPADGVKVQYMPASFFREALLYEGRLYAKTFFWICFMLNVVRLRGFVL